MSFQLTSEQKAAKKSFNTYVQESIIPFADDWDTEEFLPRQTIKSLAKKGFLGAILPKKYGGKEMDPLTFGLLCESLGGGSISVISLLTVHGMVSQALLRWGTERQKDVWLSKLASGSSIAAFALSEPNVGSDPKSVETVAEQQVDGSFLLSGKKKWISAGQVADLYLVVAQCNDAPTAFLLERSTPGLTVRPIKGLYGFRSAMLAELTLENCKVDASDIVGKIGLGFSYVASTALDHGRYCVAWACVGLAQACLEASLRYTSSRKQFGKMLRKHQLIQQMVADMATEIQAARALCLQSAILKANKEPDLVMETSIAKYFASKTALNAANSAVQIHGANGFSNDYPVQRYLRDAKITQMIEGSSQIQQIIISRYAYQKFLFRDKREQKREP
jgi:glutaryl-CoA dehydrogenase (non-decarboxylating)